MLETGTTEKGLQEAPTTSQELVEVWKVIGEKGEVQLQTGAQLGMDMVALMSCQRALDRKGGNIKASAPSAQRAINAGQAQIEKELGEAMRREPFSLEAYTDVLEAANAYLKRQQSPSKPDDETLADFTGSIKAILTDLNNS
jgi:hypothetical protein